MIDRRKLLKASTMMAAATVIPRLPLAAATTNNMPENQDALGLAGLVKKGDVSPAELLEQAIKQAEAENPKYNFLASKLYDYGRKQIANGLPEGPFRGVPWLIKDLSANIKGQPTGNGSRSYKGYRAPESSELVRRYEKAGLVIFGKTTSPEFGLTPVTESLAYGATRNPWNSDYTPGGSSGGSAAAVASGVLPAAHASDGGGSIRIPASCCGLFGLKPSRGRNPIGPGRTEGWGGLSMQHAVTRTVRDSAALLDISHGLEVGARYSAPTPESSFLSQVGRNPGKLRIALALTPPSGSPVDPECINAAKDAAKLLESMGHHVEEAAPKVSNDELSLASYAIIATSLAADVADRAKVTGIAPSAEILEKGTLEMLAFGEKMSGVSVSRAHNGLLNAASQVGQFMTNYDLILSPTLGESPVEIGKLSLNTDDFAAWGQSAARFTPFTGLFNATGQPSASIPFARSEKGLPIGIMISARYGDEATIFRVASQIEKAAPWLHTYP